jgi:26S proteasome regulatory subunit N11
MDLQRLLQAQMGGGGGRQRPQPGVEMPLADTGEQVYISSLALLKMLKHARSGIPFEVMGLMVGEIHDDYTITVVDVFSMPQKGTTISVESVDPVF